jgi:hypothetical protein
MNDVCVARAAAGRLGRWVAPATAVVGAISLATGVTTSPRSGPFCSGNCIDYPYTDAAGYVPQDYLWMYPGVLLSLLFVVLTTCLVAWVVPPHRLFAAIAACFSAIGAAVIVVDYGIALTFVQPALLAGETQDLAAWTQYNPHGVFIALENVGYALLAVAFLFLGVAMASGTSRPERVVRWIFALGGVLIIAGLLASAVIFRAELDYRFEVLALSVVWLVLISSGVLLSVAFWRSVPLPGR